MSYRCEFCSKRCKLESGLIQHLNGTVCGEKDLQKRYGVQLPTSPSRKARQRDVIGPSIGQQLTGTIRSPATQRFLSLWRQWDGTDNTGEGDDNSEVNGNALCFPMEAEEEEESDEELLPSQSILIDFQKYKDYAEKKYFGFEPKTSGQNVHVCRHFREGKEPIYGPNF